MSRRGGGNRTPSGPYGWGCPATTAPCSRLLGRSARRDDGREMAAGEAVHLYEGGTVPTANARNMDAYLVKLRALMLLEAALAAPPR